MDTTGTSPSHAAADFEAETAQVNKAVGIELRVLRTRRGWNQEQLAEAIGVDKKTIGRLERGDRSMTMGQMYRICKAFGIKPSQLVGSVEREIGIQ
ncbi:helix-turn-helix transcriptional regulator [Nocardia terpenica]|uniref:HTH cro/C1-type domain-containing protein n=1 Tax=Nocardia terpenica TaxID=455432 RepID=A0A164JWC1_9NOCA|nr:helix-turn-helix transcriptional regulator [Nocardia terpenica]KZM70786.1 hypothetical protein AWN90_40225 [Nocardia terpenica]NQE89946.1 helix-turn-helix transcriptional regulator [Nocardia terpenica]